MASRRPSRDPHDRTIAERALLTLRYHGPGTLAFRVATLPLRVTPWSHLIGHDERFGTQRAIARRWYRRERPSVTIVIPTYGPPDDVVAATNSIRATTDRRFVRIVICDDGSPSPHQDRLRALHARELRGTRIILGTRNRGFAANVNRGLRAARREDDVVLFNSDVVAHRGWLESLAYCVHKTNNVAVVGPKLVYPDGRIQSAGSYRNLGAPEWFDHRYRFAPADHGPANEAADCIGVTGACMYIPRFALEYIGLLDEAYEMAFEDMDWCLRAADLGMRSRYEPSAVLTHRESISRGRTQGERELRSQRRFWHQWGRWLDGRDVRTSSGGLRVVYVTEGTGVGGGHRDVFEHLNRLRARGHEAELWALEGRPRWFELDVPVRRFSDYARLATALAQVPAIKVATWWATAAAVWRGAVGRGYPVYFVQDIETSYYPDNTQMQSRVLSSYRQEFRYMTISRWNRSRLRELGMEATLVPPGIDLENFRPLPDVQKRDDVVLCLGRGNPLKNLPLTVDAWNALNGDRPELWMFGIEPELGERHGARYFESPSDAGVNELLNQATAFVQTSTHEGFCLPVLEAMAAGTPVVCTDAHGNRDACRDGDNCLIADPDVASVSGALQRVLGDVELRERLVSRGLDTAREYAWDTRIDELEAFYERVAAGAHDGGSEAAVR